MLSSHVTLCLHLQLDTNSVESWCDVNLMNSNRSKTSQPIMPLGDKCNVMYFSFVGTYSILCCCFVDSQSTHLLYGIQLLL